MEAFEEKIKDLKNLPVEMPANETKGCWNCKFIHFYSNQEPCNTCFKNDNMIKWQSLATSFPK